MPLTLPSLLLPFILLLEDFKITVLSLHSSRYQSQFPLPKMLVVGHFLISSYLLSWELVSKSLFTDFLLIEARFLGQIQILL